VGVVPMNAQEQDHWELRLAAGLVAGDHVLTIRFTPYDAKLGGPGAPIDGAVPVYIHVDPAPTHKSTLTLSADMQLSGGTDLDWTDVTVIGNGHKVTAADGYHGNIIIKNSFVQGL